MSNFEEIELLFAQFLTVEGSPLSESERAEIQKFIDVGEYGLGLTTAVAIFDEENKVATAKEMSLISCLAEKMSMDVTSLLNRLLRVSDG